MRGDRFQIATSSLSQSQVVIWRASAEGVHSTCELLINRFTHVNVNQQFAVMGLKVKECRISVWMLASIVICLASMAYYSDKLYPIAELSRKKN
jgi:hypothetical protein